MKKVDVIEFYARLAEADPHPETELEFVNPFTLVVAVACNPVTLAKDLAAMPSLRPVRARVLDMFPQTGHYEVLVQLRRRA